jgi:hypothetical protein
VAPRGQVGSGHVRGRLRGAVDRPAGGGRDARRDRCGKRR